MMDSAWRNAEQLRDLLLDPASILVVWNSAGSAHRLQRAYSLRVSTRRSRIAPCLEVNGSALSFDGIAGVPRIHDARSQAEQLRAIRVLQKTRRPTFVRLGVLSFGALAMTYFLTGTSALSRASAIKARSPAGMWRRLG